jgi:hypothetical protein
MRTHSFFLLILIALTSCTTMAQVNPWWINKFSPALEFEKSLREKWEEKYPDLQNIDQIKKSDLVNSWMQESHSKSNPPQLSGITVYVPFDKNLSIIPQNNRNVQFVVKITADANGKILPSRRIGNQVIEFIEFVRIRP